MGGSGRGSGPTETTAIMGEAGRTGGARTAMATAIAVAAKDTRRDMTETRVHRRTGSGSGTRAVTAIATATRPAIRGTEEHSGSGKGSSGANGTFEREAGRRTTTQTTAVDGYRRTTPSG